MKPYRFRNCSATFLGLALVVGMLVMFGCGGGGGGGTPAAPGSPILAVSAASIPFPNTVSGQTADRSVTITNTGASGLIIGAIAQADPLNAPFSINADTCSGVTLAQNQSCSTIVRFAPSGQASFGDTFDIPSNVGNQTVQVIGNGQGLNVTINRWVMTGSDVTLIVSVTDADNNPVIGLGGANFTVQESGAPRAISNFDDAIVSPVSALLALDWSISVIPFEGAIEESAKSFLGLLDLATDEAAVTKFATQVFGGAFSSDIIELEAAVDAPYPFARNATLFDDAVFDAVNRLSQRAATNRRTAIVVSDGNPFGDTSTQTLQSAVDLATSNGVSIFTLGYGDLNDGGRVMLQELASVTGGEYLESPAPDSPALTSVYLKISEILGNQYEITFATARPAGSENELTVLVDTDPPVLSGDDTVSVVY